jgi:hypothetical protein
MRDSRYTSVAVGGSMGGIRERWSRHLRNLLAMLADCGGLLAWRPRTFFFVTRSQLRQSSRRLHLCSQLMMLHLYIYIYISLSSAY